MDWRAELVFLRFGIGLLQHPLRDQLNSFIGGILDHAASGYSCIPFV